MCPNVPILWQCKRENSCLTYVNFSDKLISEKLERRVYFEID